MFVLTFSSFLFTFFLLISTNWIPIAQKISLLSHWRFKDHIFISLFFLGQNQRIDKLCGWNTSEWRQKLCKIILSIIVEKTRKHTENRAYTLANTKYSTEKLLVVRLFSRRPKIANWFFQFIRNANSAKWLSVVVVNGAKKKCMRKIALTHRVLLSFASKFRSDLALTHSMRLIRCISNARQASITQTIYFVIRFLSLPLSRFRHSFVWFLSVRCAGCICIAYVVLVFTFTSTFNGFLSTILTIYVRVQFVLVVVLLSMILNFASRHRQNHYCLFFCSFHNFVYFLSFFLFILS